MRAKSLIKISLLSSLVVFTTQVFAQDVQTPPQTTNTKLVAQTPAEDAAVTKTIYELLKKSGSLSHFKITVVTNNGLVTLSGNVDSDTQAALIAELAESVIGVSTVDATKLTVRNSQHPITDTLTTAKIKGLLIREDLFGEKDIASINTSVETKDGVVYLSGFVDNAAQIDNAIEIIKKFVPEVKQVQYNIKTIRPAG